MERDFFKKIWKSVGIIIPNICKVIEFHGSKPPTVVMGDKLLTTNQTLSTRRFTGIPSGIIQMARFFSPKNEGIFQHAMFEYQRVSTVESIQGLGKYQVSMS